MALLAAVLAMGVLGFLGTTFASLVVQHQYAAVNQSLALHALYLAEAGFELAIQEVMERQDKAFNGAAADGVIGQIMNVPLGSGKVSVTKGTQAPPVFTATGTVGTVSRVIAMAIDINLVKQDPVFDNPANLATNWPEEPPTSGQSAGGSSAIESNALKAQVNPGPGNQFTTYRYQALNPTLPPSSVIKVVRMSYMRDRNGPAANIQQHTLSFQLVDVDGGATTVFSAGPAAVSDADKGVWKLTDTRGWTTSSNKTTNRVRLYYDMKTPNWAAPTDQALNWYDFVEVITLKKSAWSEP